MCIRDRAGPHLCASNPLGMERAEAEAVYEQGRETVVAVLLELSAQNALLRREVADLRERVAQQEERIAELERRLNRNSRNSSLPPSQDPPAAPERRQAPPSGRGRGAQPGHSGHGRHLAPLESIDAVIEHWPARCACGHRFSETERRPVGTPARHQVAELPSIAVFRIAEGRHQREAKALLGEEFSGVACSDRWWAYDYLDVERRQLCWAHLVRDLTAHSEGLGAQKQFGAAGLRVAAGLFAAWAEFRADADRARLLESVDPLKEELRALLEEAAGKSARNRRHRTFAKNLLKRWPALWSFASVPGVEPTNNHAERGLRGAVIYRKLSLGSQSEEGERTVERLLSASVTCRLQRRSLFAYLSDVLAAKIRGDPIPLLT